MSAPTLKELCLKATPGTYHNDAIRIKTEDGVSVLDAYSYTRPPAEQNANAALHARLTPATLLAVYEALEALQDDAAEANAALCGFLGTLEPREIRQSYPDLMLASDKLDLSVACARHALNLLNATES